LHHLPRLRKRGFFPLRAAFFCVECYPASLEASSESPFTPPNTAAGSHFAKAGQITQGLPKRMGRPCMMMETAGFGRGRRIHTEKPV